MHIRRIFLDTAPVIYFVEGHPVFAAAVEKIFQRLQRHEWTAVVSPITLAECLVLPLQSKNKRLAELFRAALVQGAGVEFCLIDDVAAEMAAELRARYRLTLADSMQVAVALVNGCEAFLTNDEHLRRVQEIPVWLVSELEGKASE
ncbi:MAG: PIN domain-containing protein [Anaerolineales bacterium]|nr:PIN domain-containing protein [Anaerolineales bacterium]